MEKTHSNGLLAGPQPDEFELRKLRGALGNAFVRLVARDRLKIMHALEQLLFGTNKSVDYGGLWSKAEMKVCYLQLKPISHKTANEFRRWASKHLNVGHNNRLALKSLIDELVVRTWIEDPESAVER